MALAADSHPHFTTIASFTASMKEEITPLFRNVLLICSQEGLIGKQMFASDGCEISSNCSKEWSGTREDFTRKAAKLERSIELLLRKHRQTDSKEEKQAADGDDPRGGMRHNEERAIARLREKKGKLGRWLAENEDQRGSQGKIKQSNIVDNESAKMPCAHGVVQGFNGIAAVDGHRQRSIDRKKTVRGKKYFSAADFTLDAAKGKLICPAGKELFVKNRNLKTHQGYHGVVYMSKRTDCRVCALRQRCLRNSGSPVRQVGATGCGSRLGSRRQEGACDAHGHGRPPGARREEGRTWQARG